MRLIISSSSEHDTFGLHRERSKEQLPKWGRRETHLHSAPVFSSLIPPHWSLACVCSLLSPFSDSHTRQERACSPCTVPIASQALLNAGQTGEPISVLNEMFYKSVCCSQAPCHLKADISQAKLLQRAQCIYRSGGAKENSQLSGTNERTQRQSRTGEEEMPTLLRTILEWQSQAEKGDSLCCWFEPLTLKSPHVLLC